MELGAKKLELNKWQWRIMIGVRPPYMIRVFKPYIRLHFAKIIQKPGRGSVFTRNDFKGIVWDWVCPIGIVVEIIR